MALVGIEIETLVSEPDALTLIRTEHKLNCLIILPFNNYNDFNTNACLLLPVTSLHYIQIKRKQTGFESRYNATITQQKKKFLNSSTNKIMNVKFLTVFSVAFKAMEESLMTNFRAALNGTPLR